MTTIAYKDGIIACDSRTTANSMIVTDNAQKRFIIEGVTFFIAGAPSDYSRFFDLYFGRSTDAKNVDAVSFVVYSGVVYKAAVCPEVGFWKECLRADLAYAIGSGTQYALAAMDMGATAAQAVRQAMKRDVYTGGRIRTYKL